VTTRSNLIALRRIFDFFDGTGVTRPDVAAFSGLHIPHPHCLVKAGRSNPISLRRIGDSRNITMMSLQDVDVDTGGDTRNTYCVLTTRSNLIAVR
jgi:hypothetical protein